jgi:hypothetical protein
MQETWEKLEQRQQARLKVWRMAREWLEERRKDREDKPRQREEKVKKERIEKERRNTSGSEGDDGGVVWQCESPKEEGGWQEGEWEGSNPFLLRINKIKETRNFVFV